MKFIKLIVMIILLSSLDVLAAPRLNSNQEKVTFSKCVDGDTAKFMIKNEEKTVRFLAVNAPELEHESQGIEEEPYGKEASDYTCKLLKEAKNIVLEYDKNSDKEDKYGRVLSFVYVDNQLLQELLVENGYAKVAYLYGDYQHVDKLKELEQNAKMKKIGLWNDDIESDIKSSDDTSWLNKVWNFVVEILTNLFTIF